MNIKWQQIKDFCDSLSEEELKNNAGVYVREEGEHYDINSIEVCSAEDNNELSDVIEEGEAYFVIE